MYTVSEYNDLLKGSFNLKNFEIIPLESKSKVIINIYDWVWWWNRKKIQKVISYYRELGIEVILLFIRDRYECNIQ